MRQNNIRKKGERTEYGGNTKVLPKVGRVATQAAACVATNT
jgi:hypothetical protein